MVNNTYDFTSNVLNGLSQQYPRVYMPWWNVSTHSVHYTYYMMRHTLDCMRNHFSISEVMRLNVTPWNTPSVTGCLALHYSVFYNYVWLFMGSYVGAIDLTTCTIVGFDHHGKNRVGFLRSCFGSTWCLLEHNLYDIELFRRDFVSCFYLLNKSRDCIMKVLVHGASDLMWTIFKFCN